MNPEILSSIGLTSSESKTYLALLKLSPTSVGPLVDEAQVTRSKIYDILERLKHKGLVSYITKDSTRLYSAAQPSNIITYLDEKEEIIKEKKKTVNELMPQLQELYEDALEKKEAEVFIGMKGMQSAFDKLIRNFNSTDIFYAFGAGKGENTSLMQVFFHKLHKQREKNKVRTKIIFTEDSREIFSSQENSELVKKKYLLQASPAAINIYKDTTIIALLIAQPITFVIRNKQVAESFIEYFKVMWDVAKE